MPIQAVILCGGFGSRLGSLTSKTPKPLLTVGEAPFLDTLIFELARHGIRRILLLAGFAAAQVEAFAKSTPLRHSFDLQISVSVESSPAGTGGALWQARDLLDENFILLNGDSWFDINLLALRKMLVEEVKAIAAIAVRKLNDAARFGVVDMPDSDGPTWVRNFSDRPRSGGKGLVSGGVYACRRQILQQLTSECSLEQDVFPQLALSRKLLGIEFNGFFVDIGIPQALQAAQYDVPKHRTRAAALLDCEAVLNSGNWRVEDPSPIHWNDGAPSAIRALNETGMFVFLVGEDVARQSKNVGNSGSVMIDGLASAAAHLDDIVFGADILNTDISSHQVMLPRLSSGLGTSFRSVQGWPIDLERSFAIGRSGGVLAQACLRFGLRYHVFSGNNLKKFVMRVLEPNRS